MNDLITATGRDVRRVPVAEAALRAELSYCQGAYDLFLDAEEPQLQHTIAHYGALEFALVVEEPLLLLGFRFGAAEPWSLAPLRCPSRLRPDYLPPDARDDRALLAITQTDGHGQPIPPAPVRVITLPLDFSRVLNEATRSRLRMSVDPRDEARTRANLGRRFPTAGSLIARAQARCTVPA